MEPIAHSIFPYIFPPLFSLLACVFLPLFARRGQRDTKESRWFSLLCLLAFVFNLYPVSLIILPSGSPLTSITRFLYPLSTIIIPSTLEFARYKIGLRHRTTLLLGLYFVAVLTIGFIWIGHPPTFMWIFTAFNLLALIHSLMLLVSSMRNTGKSNVALYGGVTIFIALCAATFIPLPGFMHYPALTLSFIPLSLVALGLVQDIKGVEKRRYIKRGIYSSIALSFVGLALATEGIILLYYVREINVAAFWHWLVPYGAITLFSLVACILMAIFSVRRSRIQPGAILFAIICLLWSMNNLQDVLLVIFPEDIAIQAAVLNDSYLVTLAGFLVHLIFTQIGKSRSKVVFIFYAISFTLMPLILFQTHSSHTIYHYPSGPFIKAEGFVYDLFALELLAALVLGAILAGRQSRTATDPVVRRQAQYVMTAGIVATLMLLGTIPCMSGIAFYPFQQLIFIPLMLIAYGLYYKSILSVHTRRIIIARLLRAMLIFGYIIIAILTTWVLKDYSGSYILDKMIPFGIPPSISFFCAAFLSLFVMGLEQSRSETFLFSFLCFFFGLMNLDIALLGIVSDSRTALAISRLDHFFLVSFLLGGYLHFIWLVTKKKTAWWVVYLGYATGFILASFTFTDSYFKGIYAYYWGFYAQRGFLSDVVNGLWLAALFSGMIMIWRTSRATDNPDQKATLRYIFYGFGSLTILGLTDAPALYGYEMYPLGSFIFIPLIFLAYGLFKHNLFMALRNVRNLFAFFAQLALITAVALIPHEIFPQTAGHQTLYAGILFAFILYKPIQKAVNVVLNLFIRSTSEDLRQQYYGLTQKLSQIHHLQEIQDMLSQWFFRVLMNSRSIILIHDRDKDVFEGQLTWNPLFFSSFFSPGHRYREDQTISIGMNHPLVALCHQDIPLITYEIFESWIHSRGVVEEDWFSQTELIVPIFLQEKLTALIVLGGKVDGFPYSKDEQQLLQDLAPVLGPNIENARLLEGLQMEVERRTEDLNMTLIDSLLKEKEITESNEIITRQNEIFRSLLEISSQIHQIWKLDELFAFTLEHLHSLFKEFGFGIILEGGRPDVLESVSFITIPEQEQSIILHHRDKLLDPHIDEILNGEMSGKNGVVHLHPSPDVVHWTVFPMMLSSQRVIGKMIVKGNPDQTSREVITVFLGQVSAVTQGKLLMRELERMASTDGLTGVYNRSYFNQEHLQAIINANRYRIPFAIIMVDVNMLKSVNDHYGHEKGDEMIIKVARLMREICRKTDIVSRIGGDEFAALMPSTSLAQAESALARLRASEEQLNMLCKQKDGTEDLVPIRISIGLAASDEIVPEEVFKEADKRMYLDKEKFYETRERYR